MVPVDEAQLFCPQITEQEAKSSVSVNYWHGLRTKKQNNPL